MILSVFLGLAIGAFILGIIYTIVDNDIENILFGLMLAIMFIGFGILLQFLADRIDQGTKDYEQDVQFCNDQKGTLDVQNHCIVNNTPIKFPDGSYHS